MFVSLFTARPRVSAVQTETDRQHQPRDISQVGDRSFMGWTHWAISRSIVS